MAEEGTPGLDALQDALDARRHRDGAPAAAHAVRRRADAAARGRRRGRRRAGAAGRLAEPPRRAARQGARAAGDHGLAARPRRSPTATPTGSGSRSPSLIGGRDGATSSSRCRTACRPTPGSSVRTVGVHRGTYLPLLTELDAEWDVRPVRVRLARGHRQERRPPRRRGASLRRRRARCTSSPTRWAASSPATSAATSPTTWTSMDDGDGPRQRADASSCWARRTAARSRRRWR